MINKIHNKPEVNAIIGMSEKEAINHLNKFNYTMRVIIRDGKSIIYSTDYNEKRVNVIVKNNKIFNINNIG